MQILPGTIDGLDCPRQSKSGPGDRTTRRWGTVRRSRMVEGAERSTMLNDAGEDPFHIAEYLARGNPKHREAHLLHKSVACFVVLRSVAAIVRLPVNLDRQSHFKAGEVDDEAALRALFSEPEVAGLLAQCTRLAVLVTSQVLVTLDGAAAIRPYLPTRYWLAWIDFFREPVLWRDIERGAGIQLVYLVVLLGAAWANFLTKDVAN